MSHLSPYESQQILMHLGRRSEGSEDVLASECVRERSVRIPVPLFEVLYSFRVVYFQVLFQPLHVPNHVTRCVPIARFSFATRRDRHQVYDPYRLPTEAGPALDH